MKLIYLMSLLVWMQSSAIAAIKDLKIDSRWSIKYDSKVWDYQYLKPFNAVSPNILENKKENFNLILQRETHSDSFSDRNLLVEKKCSEANSYYEKNKSGKAETEVINGIKTCYINYINTSGKIVQEYVYPEKIHGANYELYTYVWISSVESTRNSVQSLLKGFIK